MYFEYAYLARSDSIMEQIPIQSARQSNGEIFGKTILTKFPRLEIDVVILYDITRAVAIATAEGLGKPLSGRIC